MKKILTILLVLIVKLVSGQKNYIGADSQFISNTFKSAPSIYTVREGRFDSGGGFYYIFKEAEGGNLEYMYGFNKEGVCNMFSMITSEENKWILLDIVKRQGWKDLGLEMWIQEGKESYFWEIVPINNGIALRCTVDPNILTKP